jgi:hypothetical protein
MFAAFSCSNDNISDAASAELMGKWVEIKTTTDTLTFKSFDNDSVMDLSRGKEMVGGHLLPKNLSGPYTFKLLPGYKISLHWMLSSFSGSNDYYFKKTGNKLTIGNFFGANSGPLLTFIKLK